MIKRYLRGEGLELEVGKLKIIIFRRGGSRRTILKLKWKNEEIEEVKAFKYLKCTLREGNGDEGHINTVAGKAKTGMGRMWVIGERLLVAQWQASMRFSDVLVRSVILHKAGVWGLKSLKELQELHERFISVRWSWTEAPRDYLVIAHTKTEKNRKEGISIGEIKHEKKLSAWGEQTLKGECLR